MFTDEMKREIEGLFEMYADKRSAVMSALYVAQRYCLFRRHVMFSEYLLDM